MLKQLVNKLKSIKHKELMILLLCVAVVLAIVAFRNYEVDGDQVSSIDYSSTMERKIEEMLKNIEGCGKVKAVLSCSSDGEKVYAASNTQLSTSTDKLFTSGGDPLVIKTNAPNILGVVVVAEGGNDPIVRFNITRAVVTLLGIDSSSVQVFTYKS